MVTLDVYDISRKKVSQVDVSEKIFDADIREHLFHEVIRMQMARRRDGTASTKTRAEVSGGGKKPWKQKGTGRARAGTIRSPLWRGGGTVFGPSPRDYGIKVNKKVKRAAMCSALTQKRKEEKLLILDGFSLSEIKTGVFKNILSELGSKSVLIVDENNNNLTLSSNNVQGVKVISPEGLNLYDLLNFKDLYITKNCLEKIHRRLEA
jgi:large subunit ribosomal protein L4